MTITYNFTLPTDKERLAYITPQLDNPTRRQLTQAADYILNGSNTTHHPDTKPEIFRSSDKHVSLSTEELIDDNDNDLYSNLTLTDFTRKPPKRKISRSPKYAAIPNMTELWDAIDNCPRTTWHQKRLYVDLCRQQYTLLEAFSPTSYPNPYYRRTPRNPAPTPFPETVDWTSPTFLDTFIAYYYDLLLLPYSPEISNLLTTFANIVQNANLSPHLTAILQLRILHVPAATISKYLAKNHNRHYAPQYLSTIYRTQIAPRLLRAAQKGETNAD